MLIEAKEHFEEALKLRGTELQPDAAIHVVHFALQLLNPSNDALRTARDAAALPEPFAHSWTSASHNTCGTPPWHSNSAVALELTPLAMCTLHCVTSPLTAADIIGDQLTGVSSANAYRRVLLQGMHQRVPAPPVHVHVPAQGLEERSSLVRDARTV
eukprot:1621436-Prymnesium_polylepis.1